MKNKSQKSSSTTEIDLKSLIHQHAKFFNELVELIPARFYLSVDDKEKPWFQGLSKVGKASAKKESKENIKKGRRARLDPEKSSTMLDLLKKSLEKENSEESPSENDEEGAEIENPLPVMRENKSVTYEELRQRLHCRIEELGSNRNARATNSETSGKMIDFQKGKRKRDGEIKDAEVKEDADFAFGHVKIGKEDEQNRNKKKKLSKQRVLEKAKKLEEAKKDPEKGEIVAKKHSLKAAANRAMGVKVHDDPKLLKQSMKKEKKRHLKNEEKWKERVESTVNSRNEKQQTTAKNIAEWIKQKKMRRIAKREKKLMRPGFEGRKEGFINES